MRIPHGSGDTVKAILGGVERSAREIRRQAPAARMIGEYAVKMLVAEVNRRAGTSRAPGSGAGAVPTAHGSAEAEPWPPPVPPVA